MVVREAEQARGARVAYVSAWDWRVRRVGV